MELRSRASSAANALARYDDVIGIALIGSVARGDAGPDSDIDLVVVTHGERRRSKLMRRLPPDLRDERLSLLCFTPDRWSSEADRGTLFLRHVVLEGVVLYDPDGVVQKGLETSAKRPPDVDGEIRRQLGHLRLYRDLSRLNGQHLFALAHLYSIGKATAIARCVQLGEATFVKEEALERVATRRPELAGASHAIARLRPFYEVTHGRRGVPLPFPAAQADDEVRSAIAAVEELACG